MSNKSLLVLFFFIVLYIFTAQGSIQTSDGMSMYLLTQSIVEHGRFSIDTDRTEILSQGKDGKYFSKYGLGQPLLAVPLYLAGVAVSNSTGLPKHFSTIFTVSLFNPIVSSLVCLLLFLCTLKIGINQRISLFLTFAYGLSTTAWHYSQDFMSEPLAALFLMLAFYFVLRAPSASEESYLYSGCAIGCAMLVRPASAIAVPCYLVYILLKERGIDKERKPLKSAAYFLSALVPFLGILLSYNFLRFGSIFGAGYQSHGFTTPLLVGLLGHLATPGKSIFLYNPFLIVALIGFYDFIKTRFHEALLVGLFFLSHLLLYSKWDCWMGGMNWGSRFLLVTFPYLMFASGFLLSRKRQIWWKASVVLFCVGFVVQIPSLVVNVSRYHYTLRLQYKSEMMNRLIYYPNDSPILGQWKEVKRIMGNLKNREYLESLVSQAKGQRSFIGKSDEEVLKNGLALNVPNFWWVYLYLYGFPLWIIAGILCFLLFCIFLLGYKSYEVCRR